MSLNKELLVLVDMLANEKDLEKEVIFQGIEKALAVATRKTFSDINPYIKVEINRQSGTYVTYRVWNVVEDFLIKHPEREKALSYAQTTHGKNIAIGDEIKILIENIELGRISAQNARHIMNIEIKNAIKEAAIEHYLKRNHGIAFGRVKYIDKGTLILDCGKIEGVIHKEQLLEKEKGKIKIGDNIKGFIDKNNPNKNAFIKNGRLVLSRTNNQFLAKLIESTVPEITNAKVAIKAIARIPGERAKVAVQAIDPNIDAKGACIGFRNQRISSVSQELCGERIDIVEYSHDQAEYAINAFSPATIQKIIVDRSNNTIDVIADKDSVAVAIGHNGENIKLVSEILGYTINVLNAEEAKIKIQEETQKLLKMFNHELELDIEDGISDLLVENGFTSLEEVAFVQPSELALIDGFNDELIEELQSRARDKILSTSIVQNKTINNLIKQLNRIAISLEKDQAKKLVEHGVKTLEEFADLSLNELVSIINTQEKDAYQMIVAARRAC